MKTQTLKAISYCFNLLSFVFQHPATQNIKAIYIYGSAVRSQLHARSDIDLFVECLRRDEIKVRKLIDSGMVNFMASKDYQKWKLFHFTFPFSIQAGQLAEWDLKLSIASEGLLLYSKNSVLPLGQRKILFTLILPKKKAHYIKMRRLLFGRDDPFYHKKESFLTSKGGEKISSNAFLVPKEHQGELIDLLSKEEITFSMKEIISLEA